MEFNWEEFLSNDNIAVHCSTEEQAIDFCRQMHEHGLKWSDGQSYLVTTLWEFYEKKACYHADGTISETEFCTEYDYKILEWSDYGKENNMNLELSNLAEEQKKQIIELAKKFEQENEKFKLENETDKLDYNNDWKVYNHNGEVGETYLQLIGIATDLFRLGLTAHTKEDAEKIRRRLLVEKELRDWAKKCKEPLRISNPEVEKYMIAYEAISNKVYAETYFTHLFGGILFSEGEVAEQAIESIGQERLIRDYFGIDN